MIARANGEVATAALADDAGSNGFDRRLGAPSAGDPHGKRQRGDNARDPAGAFSTYCGKTFADSKQVPRFVPSFSHVLNSHRRWSAVPTGSQLPRLISWAT